MASGKSQYSKEIINDTKQSAGTTYSSTHIQELVDAAKSETEMKVSSSSNNAIEEKTDGLYVDTPANKAVLDKLTENTDGTLLYNGEEISGTDPNSHTHSNKDTVLDKLGVSSNKLTFNGSLVNTEDANSHTHSNKATLDKITVDSDGDLNYNSAKIMDTSILKEFQANHKYITDEAIVVNNKIYTRNTTGTSGDSFDEAEQANWTLKTRLSQNAYTEYKESVEDAGGTPMDYVEFIKSQYSRNARRVKCDVLTQGLNSSGDAWLKCTYAEGDEEMLDYTNTTDNNIYTDYPRFKAPVDGLYYVVSQLYYSWVVSSELRVAVALVQPDTTDDKWIYYNTYNANNSFPNYCHIVPLKAGETIRPVIQASGALWINSDDYADRHWIEFGLIQTNNDLVNYPNLWTPNVEYDFGNGLYGQRFTGTITATKGYQIQKTLLTDTINIIEDYGGCVTWGNNYKVLVSYTFSNENYTVVWVSPSGSLILVYLDSSENTNNTPYDVWVKYTK